MKKAFIVILLSLTIILLLSLCLFHFQGKKNITIQTADGQQVKYQVELARTPEQQQKGLMNRTKLAPNTGMLFLFSPNRVAHMWMKDTLIPLDMVFFDRKGHVIHVHTNAKPQDETVISSIRPVAGVLEINAGEATKYNIDLDSILNLKNIK